MRVRFLTSSATALIVLQLAFAGDARAQTAPRLVDGTGLEWLITNDTVADASYVAAVAADTRPDGEHLSVLADAFDGYGGITVSVDGAAAVPYSVAWAGATDCNGRQMVLPAQTIGGLSVSRRVYVPSDDGFARWLTIIANPTGAAASVVLGVNGNLGSDAGTTIGTTSSGDAIATVADTWATTYGAFRQESSYQPRLAHVFASDGASVGVSSIALADGDDTPAWSYAFDVPAGSTVGIVYFVAALQSVEDAALKAAFLSALPPTATACLGTVAATQLANVRSGAVPGGPVANGTAALTITSPTLAPTYDASGLFLSIGGTAGSSGLQSVTWTSDRGGSGTALGLTNWMAPNIRLQPGANVITVSATYSTGTLTDTLTVTLNELKYMLPEGATSSFFTTDVLIANPNTVRAQATITFLTAEGASISQPLDLAPHARRRIRLNDIADIREVGAVSTVVSTQVATPLVVERTMFWDGTSYGSHGAIAQEGPRTTFLFGEGSQGFFDTYLLLANPNTTPARATVHFFREGDSAITRTYDLAPTSRFNVYGGSLPELANRSFSMAVESDLPIMAERAMYFGSPLFDGGHDSEGAGIASPTWHFAEGASGTFFDTYFLLGNSGPRTATVTMTYLLPDGTKVPVVRTVPPYGRTTVFADNEHPSLANTAFGLSIASSEPITAERSMYWGGTSTSWYEAHNSFGVIEPGRRWGLAEGRVGQADRFETYILIGNNANVESVINVTFLRDGGGSVVRQFTVPANSRYNINVKAMVPELIDEDFSTIIDVLDGAPVTVERSLYHSAAGVQFRGGTNTQAVRLP